MEQGMDVQVKKCIRLTKVGTETPVMLPKVKLTKEQKQLLLPTKKSKKAATTGTKKGKKSDGKFQMKISGFFSPPSKKKAVEKEEVLDEEEDRETPDSGF